MMTALGDFMNFIFTVGVAFIALGIGGGVFGQNFLEPKRQIAYALIAIADAILMAAEHLKS